MAHAQCSAVLPAPVVNATGRNSTAWSGEDRRRRRYLHLKGISQVVLSPPRQRVTGQQVFDPNRSHFSLQSQNITVVKVRFVEASTAYMV